jgi:demethylmenaquinone methyltransferase/2-methoxy-6-polyprenyl-1,4-benzoquinol methylase
MPNPYYEPGAQRAAKVRALFGKIAPRYDLLNDLQSFGLHRYWKRRVLELTQAQAGQWGLDVCCGTGDLALAMARHGVNVVGLDFSEQMLAVAAGKRSKFQSAVSKPRGASSPARSSPITHHVFLRGDAQQLPFCDGCFDIVTVGYGLRNLTDWGVGLREMQRVAKSGGRLLVLEFGKPDNPIWRRAYFAYLWLFVPCLGLVAAGDANAYAYILESLKHYSAQHAVALKMEELGLVETRVVSLLGGVMSINYARKKSGTFVQNTAVGTK